MCQPSVLCVCARALDFNVAVGRVPLLGRAAPARLRVAESTTTTTTITTTTTNTTTSSLPAMPPATPDGFAFRLHCADPAGCPPPPPDEPVAAARRQYALALWGGECLCPLAEWLRCTANAVEHALRQRELASIAARLHALLLPLPVLTHKMRRAVPAALPLLAPVHRPSIQFRASDTPHSHPKLESESKVDGIHPVECAAISDALSSGPGSVVAAAAAAAAVAAPSRGQSAPLLRQWCSAIECREYVRKTYAALPPR